MPKWRQSMNAVVNKEDIYRRQNMGNSSGIGKRCGLVLVDFVNGVPTKVSGELTLHGITRPVDLQLPLFKCIPHPMLKRELCGADAMATIKRDEFGLDAGKDYGFKMDVALRIQVEAVAEK